MSIGRIIITCLLMAGTASLRAANYYAARNGQTETSPYDTWAKAASNIQEAVNAANTNDTVWIGAGTYTLPPNLTNFFLGSNVVYIRKPMTLRSSNGLPESVIIDGSGTNRGIAFNYTISTTNRFVLDGLTISNCRATNIGGGIFYWLGEGKGWTSDVRNCVIRNCTVAWGTNSGSYNYSGCYGGAIGSWQNVSYFCLILSNSTIQGNSTFSGGQGGGVYLRASGSHQFIGSLIENNRAGNGGGMCIENDGTFDRCIIRNNQSTNTTVSGGGGLQLIYFLGTLKNCLIYGNYSGSYGGGLYITYARPSLYNCTIVNNIGASGAGISARFVSQGGGLISYNSIIYSNYNQDNMSIDGVSSSTNAFLYNTCIYSTNGSWGALSGNITNNPLWTDFNGSNFRLARNSPCVNAGTNQGWMTDALDLDGKQRLRYGTVDIGAYEFIFAGSIYKVH